MKQQVRKSVTANVHGSNGSANRIVLVGTYKGDQLAKWRGWYNYPVSEEDQIAEADAASIAELWLFKGTKEQKTYKAEFVGVKTREELVRNYGYPAKGRAHGEKYLLFKTKLKYQHKLTPPEDAARVIVRTADFATAPKVRKQLKAYLESPDRKDPDLAKRLPEVVTKLRPEQLRVSELAYQMSFWDMPKMEILKPDVPFPPPEHPKFTFIDLFAGIGGFRIAMQRCGGECVFTSEFDHAAQKTYQANFGDMPFGDITKQETHNKIPEKFDVVCAGFPCQAFSLAGKRLGFKDLYKGMSRGTLFAEVVKICERHKPKAVFCENVKGLYIHDKGNTFKVIKNEFESIGYKLFYRILNSKDFGVPQHRERIYMVAFRNDYAENGWRFPIFFFAGETLRRSARL